MADDKNKKIEELQEEQLDEVNGGYKFSTFFGKGKVR